MTEINTENREQESMESLKYQLRKWRSLVKHLPQCDFDRDDVAAIEKLVLLGKIAVE